tara:strand:+ start:273 stop:386 length:114 start_codon:yes stop_codon:yes gene_type:complete
MTDNNAWKYRAIKEMKWDEERRKKWAEDKKKKEKDEE